MRVVILTSMQHGPASEILPQLAEHPDIEIAMVILSHGVPRSRWKTYKMKARKLRRIGLFGGFVGLHIRTWNEGFGSEDLFPVVEALGLRLEETPRIGCERTRELFREADAELGVSLGNPIIGRSVFSIPPRGMINVHGDVLPRFRGGTSIIWPIHENVPEAGFTIHKIDRGIDTGPILHVERFPIRFMETLKQTYRENVIEIKRRVPPALVKLLANYADFETGSSAQGEGNSFTTPSLRQFLKMLRNHRQLRQTHAEAQEG